MNGKSSVFPWFLDGKSLKNIQNLNPLGETFFMYGFTDFTWKKTRSVCRKFFLKNIVFQDCHNDNMSQ
jgi:hypothetical protein